MPSTDRQHRTGVALIIAAAIAWSTAPFFTRLLHFDSWTILFWRGLFGGGFISLFLVATQGWSGARGLVTMKANGWLVACLSTLGMVSFIPSLQLTRVANVAIIIAVQPFAAAGIAWVWLREAAAPRTLLAMHEQPEVPRVAVAAELQLREREGVHQRVGEAPERRLVERPDELVPHVPHPEPHLRRERERDEEPDELLANFLPDQALHLRRS